MNIKDLLTVTQAAGRLGLTRDGVLGAIYRGSLKAVQVGGRYIITPDEVIRYFNENKGKPGRRVAGKTIAQLPPPKAGRVPILKPVTRPRDTRQDEEPRELTYEPAEE